MKSKIVYSKFSWVATAIALALLVLALVLCFVDKWLFVIMSVVIGGTLLSALWYAPLSIELTDKDLLVNRVASPDKRFPLHSIKSVELHNPKLAIRVCGSGGFFGFWGRFSERKVGQYFAYFGKESDCFLLTLKNGKKYLLGCENPAQMVEAIQSKL